jgi:hypothetical protein
LAACGESGGVGGSTSAASPGGHGNSSTSANTSTNWAGYVVSGSAGAFSSVAGAWNVPQVSCPNGSSTGSSTWLGIGGASVSDQSLIQAGTGQDCSGGASYYAWWEIFPAPSTTLSSSSYPVQPGDPISVTIDGSAIVSWTITIKNTRANWTFTTTAPFSGSQQSAEWIEEAQLQAGTSGAGQVTLADFGHVSFSALTANGSNPGLTTADELVMVDSSNQPIATPSAPQGGNAFNVCRGSSC